jgi:Flp pilus assembly protein TadG
MGARREWRGERGAVFVQVGIAVFVLMGLNVFVLDYGIMWMSRRQAQNAADAGAFAGAVARNYDEFTDPPASNGPTVQSANQAVAANLIWQEAGTTAVSFDCPPGITGRCVQVDVHRDGTLGSNALPTVFGPIFSVTSQGVRATATAQAVNGNMTNCLRPFAFPDEWEDNRSPLDEFNRYVESGPSAGTLLPAPQDRYFPPDDTQAIGTNLNDLGDRIDFQLDRPQTDPIATGLLLPLDLPGANTYLQDIAACNGQPVALRDLMPLAPPPVAGTTYAAFEALVAQDPGATWDFTTHTIGNSCAPGCAAVSPRLIAVALFDPDQYQLRRATSDWSGCPTAGPCVTIANIAAVFIHRLSGGTGHGHYMRYPGMSITTAPTFVDEGSWLVSTTLIR